MTTATATEIQNNFGRYLQMVQSGEEVIILKMGKEVARLISCDKSVSFLTDSLIGILQDDYDDKDIQTEKMKNYEDDILQGGPT